MKRWWLFSPAMDVAVFGGSALLAMLALAVGSACGLLDHETPDWTWIYAVLLVDVAHVWSTGFRVYFDRQEVARRPFLYGLTPVVALSVGMALYSQGALVFWRVMAYLAVWHFVRQQYGWVMLYRGRCGERGGRLLDAVTIHAATLYPLIYWHAHMPRKFWWFLAGDFASVPSLLETLARPVFWGSLLIYAGRALTLWRRGTPNPGRDMVVATTALCWYVGIVACNSDYAFTVTNVLIHGIPYMALVYYYTQRTGERRGPNLLQFLLTIWFLAYCEEMFWDRTVWHDRAWLFGHGWAAENLQAVLVPLLAVPQITHYVLDGFIWRRKTNPQLARL